MSDMKRKLGARALALATAVHLPTYGCAGSRDESAQIETTSAQIETKSEALTLDEIPPPPQVDVAKPVAEGQASRVQLSPPGDLRPTTGTIVIPPQQENRRLYRSREEIGDRDVIEPKMEKELPVRAAPPSRSRLSGAEYTRRADAYLRRWEEEKGQHAHLSVEAQETVKAQLKREVIGE